MLFCYILFNTNLRQQRPSVDTFVRVGIIQRTGDNSPFSPCLPPAFTVGEQSHFDNSDYDSDQVYLCCAKNKIRVFQLLRDDAVDLFKMYHNQNQNARGVANVAGNAKVKGRWPPKAFLKEIVEEFYVDMMFIY